MLTVETLLLAIDKINKNVYGEVSVYVGPDGSPAETVTLELGANEPFIVIK